VNPHQIVEAVLFASDAPLTADEIARADERLDEDTVERALQLLQAEYDDAGRAFEVNELAEGYQILTRPEYAPYLERFDTVPRPSRLSGPALETLAIIAYRQPLGRVEVEYIRGVGSSGVIKTLMDRQLIEVVGRGEGLGRPLLYGTTTFFLEHFGFRSLENLPRPEELPVVLRDRVPLDPEEAEGEEAEGSDEAGADEAEAEGGGESEENGEPGERREAGESRGGGGGDGAGPGETQDDAAGEAGEVGAPGGTQERAAGAGAGDGGDPTDPRVG
jgi:segregation and condensation protein B